jgi:hypothetical protein
MKLVLQIAAGILLASCLQWLLVNFVIVPAAIRADLRAMPETSRIPDRLPDPPPAFDAEYPCAHMEYGSSVRKWCEANEAARKAKAESSPARSSN